MKKHTQLLKAHFRHILWITLAVVVVSCVSEVAVYQPSKVISNLFNSQITKSLEPQSESVKVFKPQPIFIQEKGPFGFIQSDNKIVEINGVQTKSLSITMDYSPVIEASMGTKQRFKTQSLRCGDIAKIKVSITGINISSPIYPAGVDGNNQIDATAGCTISATIPNVPFGTARIATVEAYSAGPVLIPGSTVKAAFDVSANPTNVNIGFNTTPVGATVEQIRASNTFIAAYMSLPNLQTLVNNITGASGTFPNLSYTYHPSLVDTNQLATDLLGNGGDSTALIPGDYDNEFYSTVTGTLAGLLGTDTASIQITDPASPISINNANGAFTFSSNVKNGTWVVHAEATGYTASATPSVSVGAGGSQSAGTITFTWATTPNISSLSAGSGGVGTSIQINGTGFHPQIAGNTVTFNGTNATVTAASPTQLTVTVPAAADGNVQVTVGTVASNTIAFQVFPTISITAPTASAVVNGNSSSITTSVASGNAISQVEFFLDGVGGTSLGTDNTGPTYTLNWDTTAHTSVGHTLVARITDSASHQTTSAAVNITINQLPTNGAINASKNPVIGLGYPSKLDISANDTDNTLNNASYTWSCDGGCGTFNRTDSPNVIWSAPLSVGGPYTLRVSISDGVNAPVQQTLNIPVTSGNADVVFTGSTVQSVVTSFVGKYPGPPTTGLVDGTGAAARFNIISDIVMDNSGNFYVADQFNHAIRKITPAGVVTTIAGSAPPTVTSGYLDNTGTAARFNGPTGLAIDPVGNILYIADQNNAAIRRLDLSNNVVTTIAGDPPPGVVTGYADGTGTTATRFTQPIGLAYKANNLYIADFANHAIRKMDLGTGVVTTIGGEPPPGATSGFTDATGTAAFFFNPARIAIDASDNLYISDVGNRVIRKMTSAGVVTTLAGPNPIQPVGYVDGIGSAARFNQPFGLAIGPDGNIYLADTTNKSIRKITPTGMVTTLAGGGPAGSGFVDGTGFAARFNDPRAVVFDSAGNMYVADQLNHVIRKILF